MKGQNQHHSTASYEGYAQCKQKEELLAIDIIIFQEQHDLVSWTSEILRKPSDVFTENGEN